ncbi:hypothetical protein HNR30_009421, partial [Nonomuraea soli]
MRHTEAVLESGVRISALVIEAHPPERLRAGGPDVLIVSYTTPEESVTVQVSDSVSAEGLKPGDFVEVVYDPQDVDYVVLASLGDATYYYVFIALAGVMVLPRFDGHLISEGPWFPEEGVHCAEQLSAGV